MGDDVQQIVESLSLDQKIAMMHGDPTFWRGLVDILEGGYGDHPWTAGAVPELDIEGVRFVDGPRGVVLHGATTFPVAMARGATWDVELEERIGDAIGKEVRAVGANLFGGVCVNLLRHPAWGRAQETYGEDPFLLGELGAALTRGVQRHAMACAKHYALNSMENARFRVDVQISDRALRELYLPQFRRVVDAGVACIMSAYNKVNGDWCGHHRGLLTDILKEEWKFEGFVVTDFIFGIRSAERAALAGLDLEMPFHMHFARHLQRYVRDGVIPRQRVDDAVSRIIRMQRRFVPQKEYPRTLLAAREHRALAREAAEKSIVLLQNDGVLPIEAGADVAVIGRLAGVANIGDKGSSNTRPDYVVTPLDGIRHSERAGRISFDDGRRLCRAAKAAAAADVAVVVVGYTSEDEGEFVAPGTYRELARYIPLPRLRDIPSVARAAFRALRDRNPGGFAPGGDREELTLTSQDERLIEAVGRANRNTIVVVMGGSAIIMERWRSQAAAILMAWYPGMEGGHALADILFGEVNPGARLPFVIPTSAEHLPHFDSGAREIRYDLWHGYRKLQRDGQRAAFPFGFGLSYTTFEYDELQIEQESLPARGTLQAAVTVTNVGTRSGDEVVQLYFRVLDSAVPRAPKTLCAFARVSLQPDETKTVELEVPLSRLAYWNEREAQFVVEESSYELIAASNADDERSVARFRVASSA